MAKFAANLSMLFCEVPFLDRFEAASQAGFKAVEYLFPYAWDAELLARKLKEYELKQVLFNMYPGEWDRGERGLAAQPDKIQEFQYHAKQALDYARVLECPKVHVMSGLHRPEFGYDAQKKVWLANIRWISELFAPYGVEVLIEALNTYDVPNYFLAHQYEVASLIKEVNCHNVRLQLDYYHAQIMDGDLTRLTQALWPLIGHVQIAGVPTRNEPNIGELAYGHIVQLLDCLGYDGWIGCEYHPLSTTFAGLSWFDTIK